VDVIERVSGARGRDDPPRGHLCPSHARPEPVQRDAEQVGDRIVDRVEPVPSLPELQERILHEFLRVGRAPRDEVQGSVQAFVHVEEELFEARRTRVRLAFPA
jgi:hypothetical protein